MKNLITLLLTLGIVTGAMATEKIHIQKTADDKVIVALNEPASETLQIKMSNKDGEVVLRDRIVKGQTFAAKLNLEPLPYGTYNVEIIGDNGIVKNSKVNFTDSSQRDIYSRVTKIDENSFRLLVSTLTASNVKVSIYDQDKLIHSETVSNPQGLHKIYTVEGPSDSGVSFKVESLSNAKVATALD
ncbi:hypothetical protein [Algoriphagus sediminis]|uniref:DUF4397 domain-containing protein n=1 Tax=Algoriphagus sediminis TaxID=3057113 RepID=A0ABT7YF32_9BACT|nr:hypothetical protein [Algoriphagus sediminis]MDN3204930.1 hypothetical protein [Algoriphagus sediminis]